MSDVTEAIRKEVLPEVSPKQGKGNLVALSHNQAHPGDVKATDFTVINGDALSFDGQCGTTRAEYARLSKAGEEARRPPRS